MHTDIPKKTISGDQGPRALDLQKTISTILKLALSDLPLEECLAQVLEEITTHTWLVRGEQGALYLADDTRHTLQLVAHHGLDESQLETGRDDDHGKQAGGQAPARKVVFRTAPEDLPRDITYEKTDTRGSYSVPVKSGPHILGVLKLNTGSDHIPVPGETTYLATLADTLALVIQRKRAELDRQLLAHAIDNADDMVFFTDAGGRIVYANRSVEKITGYTLPELQRQNPRIFKSGKMNPDYYHKLWSTLLSGEPFHGEVINRRKNGELFYYEQTITPLQDQNGRISHFISTGRDNTERIQARQEAERLAAFPEVNPLPVLEMNAGGQITYTNPAVRRLLQEQNLGPRQIRRLLPENIRHLVQTSLRDQQDISPREIRLKSRILSWTGHPLPKLQLVHLYTNDITEQVRAREEAERLAAFPEVNPLPVLEMNAGGQITYSNPAVRRLLQEQNLGPRQIRRLLPENIRHLVQTSLRDQQDISPREIRLKSRILSWTGHPLPKLQLVHLYANDITELVRARETAEAANRVKTLFIANMSHEIRTPLNSILGFTELIESSFKEQATPEEQEFFEVVQTGGERLLRTVHEILDISQIEAGALEIRRRQVDLAAMLKDLEERYRSQAVRQGLDFTLDLQVPAARILSDKTTLQQALKHLLDNALKYTPRGGVRITLLSSGNSYRLTVADTGIGMSETYLQELFQPFSQESDGFTKKYQGIGLGLALTKRYLDLNRVAISVRSREGRGTTVTLTFGKPAESGDQ